MKRLSTIVCILCLASGGFVQRGLPPKYKTRSTLVTKYTQHLDFLPLLVKLLKVPKGWEVSVAASGLGRARMLYSGKDGRLYVTRRDAGDVLMLSDADGNNKFEWASNSLNRYPFRRN